MTLEPPREFYSLQFNYGPPPVPAEMLHPAPTLAMLHALEDRLAQGPTLDVEAITDHHFAHGVYGRAVRIPAGTVCVGRIHKFSTLNILAQGEMTVTTPEGMRRIKAPAIFTSEPGCKKAAFAHTDCVFLNVHASHETDLAKLEAEFIEPEPGRELTSTKRIAQEENA